MSTNALLMFPGLFLGKKLAEAIVGDEKQIKPIEELALEARRQEIRMSMLREEARVAQEISIARRIELAQEVEIEEFYDASGQGSLGVDIKESGALIGLSGSGRRVTKRIYKFTGFREDIASSLIDAETKDEQRDQQIDEGEVVQML